MRKIDQKITQAQEPEALLWHLQLTLNAAHTEARLAFQRQLENYEILSTRIKQIQDALPKKARDINIDHGLATRPINPGNDRANESRRPKKIRARSAPKLRG